MSWIKPDSLAKLRGHAANIAARTSAAGFSSSTLQRFRAELDADFPPTETGWLVVPTDTRLRLQTLAAELELILLPRNLAEIDVPVIRYVLAEEMVG